MIVKIILYLCCVYVAFSSAAGFLFGQLFFGTFSVGATLAGLAGIGVCGMAVLAREVTRRRTPITTLLGLVCIVGVGLDIYGYYGVPRGAGNYYAWGLVGPYLIGLFVLLLGEEFRWGYLSTSGPPPLPAVESDLGE